jgi:hypothetical protein
VKIIVLGLAALTVSANAQVSELDAGRAQGEMHSRVNESINAYVKRIGIDPSYYGYCRTKMYLETRHDNDGSIPFGVNYRNIKDSEQLNIIISVREEFERSFLTLCLADAKRAIKAAEGP